MKKNLKCPCGAFIRGTDEDDLVDKVKEHLADKHPDLSYEREQILFLAF